MADDAKTPDAKGKVDGKATDDEKVDGKATDDKGGKTDDTGDDGKIVFDSQADLNKFVGKRLRRDRRQRAAGAKIDGEGKTSKDDDADKGGDKGKATDDSADKANAAADARVEKAQRLAVNANALVAATEAGLSGERAKAAVRLAELDLVDVIDDDGEVDEDAIDDAIDAALDTYPFLKSTDDAPADDKGDKGAKKGVGGKTDKSDGDKPPGSVTAEEFAKMGYFERVQLRNRDPQLYETLAKVA